MIRGSVMTWRIGDRVLRGEVDNRVRGKITGTLWLAGRRDPVRLELEGDGLPDIAGRLLKFCNPHPPTEPAPQIARFDTEPRLGQEGRK